MRTTPPRPSTTDQAPQPANRAERRAARRGRPTDGTATGAAAPRSSGPAPHVKPVHVRTDFAARRTG
ncbi:MULTISPECIES: hypothetical protein [Pseudonocardia]|uniref:Uncharacterized protein n=2 Tax=Pseudonocardia TaxID=1847 RepID=A0A1Y2MGT8_PSEAH|nr:MULTISPECIES: hypothetical protein [Pseudonocardia]OSY34504.1 hypothetical protein BG845_06798 [Pseudonocardia autotrophica]TDN72448.1 hypothetical protein C8E95_1505 [Pseudonocardia autotrophica]BBG03157.1 hypothetical protein Pdca_43660 [Pseudonocardia autotrophica]GEC23773.1 hypothetical protein PSA01_08020 [Pseudonocardia saturnea]